ncbi:RE1-silencing transcription factor isoform X2 [Eleginops maclovinus]|uniref:RE1-silencing transcription factor isoform X2 n=1 Tax=Eleginops maclovinus TaxID=56733 RepID=UPI003080B4DE
MAAQMLFPVFPADGAQSDLPPPQLVMLANVAAVTAEGGAEEEKEMMELKTVGCSYSDSEEESLISYDSQNHREVCIVEYPESPGPSPAVAGDDTEEAGDKAEDLSRPPASTKTPKQSAERHQSPALPPESTKKKKPFHCKPCHFQAQSERDFVEHLGSHGASKMRVVNRVEGRSRTRASGAESPESRALSGGEAESGGEAGAGDIKGLIRCERCGYNTNRYDHYIAHLKHHSKEGQDHRVFKCTLCPYTTVSQYHWRKHLRNHFPSKLHTCSQCSYFSDRKSNYIQHIRTHTGVRPFQCLYCDYSSSQKTHLTRHMRTHSGERPFKCESCNYLAANQHEVTRHARQVHNGPKPLSCPYCEYKTADRSNYKKHVELHLNPRQFVCPLCKYAASKKCNLQYHLKSRHAGCNVVLDVSKVKLRNKKHSGEENAGARTSKMDNSSGVDEDFDMEDNDVDKDLESSPINLSIKPSINQSLQSEVLDKTPKKTTALPEKEKVQKVKVEPEKKVTTRQKKNEKVNKNLLETETPVPDKAKRRVKKMPVGKTAVKEQVTGTKPKKETEEPQRPEEVGVMRSKEEHELIPERKKNDGGGKENKTLNKPRKSASKKSENISEPVKEAEQNPVSPEKPQKEKTRKRKVVEALDLSRNSSSETPSKTRRVKKPASEETKKTSEATRSTSMSNGTSTVKTKKTKKSTDLKQTVDAEKDQKPSVLSPSTDVQPDHQTETTTSEPCLTGPKSSEFGTRSSETGTTPSETGTTPSETGTTPSETGTLSSEIGTPSSETGTTPLETGTTTSETGTTPSETGTTPSETGTTPSETGTTPSETGTLSSEIGTPSSETGTTPLETGTLSSETGTTSSEPCLIGTISSETGTSPAKKKKKISAGETPPSVPEPTLTKTSKEMEVSPPCSSGEDTPSPAEDRSVPTFVKPPPPSLVMPGRSKLADAEDDEGVHSSQEGGSDISDSASEGSDDSGLNGARSCKMANDPETPTDEIPTPTELKSHLCIFCDRTFPLEVVYRRHLNRHLVNVYFMQDGSAKAQE